MLHFFVAKRRACRSAGDGFHVRNFLVGTFIVRLAEGWPDFPGPLPQNGSYILYDGYWIERKHFHQLDFSTAQISNWHCVIQWAGDHWRVADSSRNGTSVIRGGEVVARLLSGESAEVQVGDIIDLAGQGRILLSAYDNADGKWGEDTPRDAPEREHFPN